jgi:hypothetical protein
MSVLSGGGALALMVLLVAPQGGPETLDLVAKAAPKGAATGAITVPMIVQIDRYTPEHARTTMTDGLKHGGYPGFLKALRDAPPAGTLEVAGEKFVIRWAREVPTEKGRTISLITETPVFFVGIGRRGAPPTAGYEVAVIQLTVDKAGKGTGTMAAAARVKPGGETGVRLDTYADSPLTLTATVRAGR